ncbi:MAG: hypothetical protein ABI665_05200 [Vicinamibacterales bacterium]
MNFSLLLAAMAMILSLIPQVTKMTPDSPKFMNDEPKGSSWRVFAVDSYEKGPIAVVEVEEVRQQNPPSLWAITAKNRSLAPVNSYRITAVVLTGDNKVKATQMLPAVKNLAPGKVTRQQIKIFPTILNPSDRVVFYVGELTTDDGPWKVDKNEVTALMAAMGARYPAQ